MYELANKDVNSAKAQLKTYPEKDWSTITEKYQSRLSQIVIDMDDLVLKSHDMSHQMMDLKSKLSRHNNFTPVSQAQVDVQREKVSSYEDQISKHNSKLLSLKGEVEKIDAKISTIATVKEDNNLDDYRQKLNAFNVLESSVMELKHLYERESSALKQQERSIKILDEVPCGDSFPTCKFIKDAHAIKGNINDQREKTAFSLSKLESATQSLQELKIENIKEKVEKLQKLHDMHSKLQLDLSNKKAEIYKCETTLDGLISNNTQATTKLAELEQALKNDENEEVVSLKSEIISLSRHITEADKQKLLLASEKGKISSDLEKTKEEFLARETLLQKMKIHELITNAFCKKGIPSVIVSSQLPIINAEISKILTGIVDFTVELEVDGDTDSMDVYINYGDSRRIIELASGMEKMISSIAIRVALINISSLPKTDMFIIDEGFGALDDAGVEACNRLLSSLKRYFKTVFVITHVDGVKDAADFVLEITKNEKDSRVVYD